MAIITLAQSGYTGWNLRKIHILTTISNLAAPTLTETGNGTDISPQLITYEGFSEEGSDIASQSFVGPALLLAGPSSLVPASITTRASKVAADDIRSVLDVDDVVFIVIYTEGLVADGGDTFDVFKMLVTSQQKSSDPGEAATIITKFSYEAQPQLNVTIPIA